MGLRSLNGSGLPDNGRRSFIIGDGESTVFYSDQDGIGLINPSVTHVETNATPSVELTDTYPNVQYNRANGEFTITYQDPPPLNGHRIWLHGLPTGNTGTGFTTTHS